MLSPAIDLSEFRGHTIKLHFVFERTDQGAATEKVGWALDFVKVDYSCPALRRVYIIAVISAFRVLLPALQILKAAPPQQLAKLMVQGVSPAHADQDCLARMGLQRPSTPTEWIYALLLRGALKTAGYQGQ